MNRRTKVYWANFVLFQLLWPACVLGAANGTVLPGVIIIATMLLLQIVPKERNPVDIILLLTTMPFGYALDCLWLTTGVLEFKAPWPGLPLAPLWIAALWVGLALSINHSLAWLQRWPLRSSFVIAFLAPISYLFAERTGAVTIHLSVVELFFVISPSWFIVILGTLLTASKLQLSNQSLNIMHRKVMT